jgi:AraC family transcriptional regulator
LAKIAVELETAVARKNLNGLSGTAKERVLATGSGFVVADVLCTSGPQDHAFEENHSHVSIAMVVAGSFQYRNALGKVLLTPGSLLLGDAGQCFECGHEHGVGDRCIAFKFDVDYFETLARDAGLRPTLGAPRLPAQRELAPLFAKACAGLTVGEPIDWEELGLELASRVLGITNGPLNKAPEYKPSSVARITRVVREIEQRPYGDLKIGNLARTARLSPYHFLRVFQEQTGLTPHQFILRTRLRNAATRLALGDGKILDIALDCGFGDVSNFNRAYRKEFAVSPRDFRK